MTKARDLANIISGGFTADDIPNLDAAKITSGTFADARIAASNVSQHATSFDDNKIINDLSTLGLRVHTQENLNVSNTNSASFDVFNDANGITNLTNCSRDAAEYISSLTIGSSSYDSGDRTSIYTITDNGNWEAGSPARTALIDGTMSGQNLVLAQAASQTGVFVRFDLGAGNSKVYTGAKFTTQNTSAQAGSAWAWEGSNDNTAYTTLLGGQVWGDGSNNPQEFSWSNTVGYRYLQFVDRTGSAITTNYNNYNYEWNFKSATATLNATGSFEGVAITAGASTSKMGAVITYQNNAGTNTLNTDIILKLSADNGSNYSTATLTALPDFSTGIKMAKVNDLSVTAGTSLKYKIEFANQASGSKEARIRGVALQY